MLRLADLAGGNAVLLHVSLGVGFTKAIEVTASESGETPLTLLLFGEADGLVPLTIAADVDVKALVLWQGGVPTFMTAGVVLANVGRGVAVLFHRLGNGNSRGRNILVLLRAFEFGLLLGDTRRLVSVQVAHHVDPIVDPCRILAGEDGRSARRTVRLHVSVGEAESILGELVDVGSKKLTTVSAHGRLGSTELVPAKVIDQVDDDVGLFHFLSCYDGHA